MSEFQEFKTTFGKYSFVEVIGEGGSGRILLVKDEDGEEYALKLLDPNKVTSNKLKRFRNELNFCQRNKHQNIVSVLDHGVITHKNIDSPFYIMRRYKSSLRAIIEEGVPKEKALEFFSQILDGIEAAHLQNVYHRDIKPENILFDVNSNSLLIADFGIAHFEEEELYTSIETRDQERLANFQYAAPEQRTRRTKVDHRADIYALGLILNELYTGVIPAGTGYKIIGEQYSEYAYLDEVVETMIKQEPSQRYNSIEQIKYELLARKIQYINLQRLDTVRREVIKDPEVNDPLINDPVRIVGFDWDNGKLTLTLNHVVTEPWIQSLLHMGSYSSLLGAGPENYKFYSNKATTGVQEPDVQRAIDYFKDWLPKANQVYTNQVHAAIRKEKEQKIKELQKERDQREARQRVLKNTII